MFFFDESVIGKTLYQQKMINQRVFIFFVQRIVNFILKSPFLTFDAPETCLRFQTMNELISPDNFLVYSHKNNYYSTFF